MAVDLKALKKISEGDPKTKVMVTRRWLTEVYRVLAEAETAKLKAAANAKVLNKTRDVIDDIAETFLRGGR